MADKYVATKDFTLILWGKHSGKEYKVGDAFVPPDDWVRDEEYERGFAKGRITFGEPYEELMGYDDNNRPIYESFTRRVLLPVKLA